MQEWVDLVEGSPFFWALVQFYGIYPILTSMIWMLNGVVYYYRHDRGGKPDQLPGEYPLVTILLPAYYEEASIARSLRGLTSIDYPNFEVIVINDGSTDRTVERVRPFLSDRRVRLIDKKVNEGKAMALNDAIGCANGELVVIMDADAIPDKRMLSKMVPHFRNPVVGAVAGNPRVRNRDRLLAKLQAVEFSSVVGLLRRAQRIWGRVMCVSGVCGMFRKSAMVEVELYSPGMATEDIDLTWKLQCAGWEVRYEARAIVWMEVPESIQVLWKQRTRWALGLGQVLKRYARVLVTPKLYRMLPLYVESAMSVLWAGTFIFITSYWLIFNLLGASPSGGSLIPNYWGLMIFCCCLMQLTLGTFIDAKYEPEIPSELPVSILYPSFYWTMMCLSSFIFSSKGFLKKLQITLPTVWRIERQEGA